jgi:hypothetical protein
MSMTHATFNQTQTSSVNEGVVRVLRRMLKHHGLFAFCNQDPLKHVDDAERTAFMKVFHDHMCSEFLSGIDESIQADCQLHYKRHHEMMTLARYACLYDPDPWSRWMHDDGHGAYKQQFLHAVASGGLSIKDIAIASEKDGAKAMESLDHQDPWKQSLVEKWAEQITDIFSTHNVHAHQRAHVSLIKQWRRHQPAAVHHFDQMCDRLMIMALAQSRQTSLMKKLNASSFMVFRYMSGSSSVDQRIHESIGSCHEIGEWFHDLRPDYMRNPAYKNLTSDEWCEEVIMPWMRDCLRQKSQNGDDMRIIIAGHPEWLDDAWWLKAIGMMQDTSAM